MAKRWVRRPEGSTWGDWGEDDELGRINLITSEKVPEGVREVRAGKSFCLSLPLDFPGGSSLNQRRYPPIIRPTEDLAHKPDTFYNVVAKDSIAPEYIDVWSDDVVTLWTQYSTQWDALVHQGALFDADGTGRPSRCTTTAINRTWTSSGRRATPRATEAGASPSPGTSALSTWPRTVCRDRKSVV